MSQDKPTRREALKLGLLTAFASLPVPKALAQETTPRHSGAHMAPPAPAKRQPNKYSWLKPEEALFIEAATERLIPADDKFGGAKEAGVTNYFDKQLGGRWGAGERLYRSGPWKKGAPSQGYQLPFTPAEFMRTGLTAILKEFAGKTPFHKMSTSEQDAWLHELEKSDRDLDGIPAKQFFATFLRTTNEGFFADPAYGGNHDMISWRMVGFPGAGASYFELVDKHGIKITRAPISLSEDSHGHMHMDPNISANGLKK